MNNTAVHLFFRKAVLHKPFFSSEGLFWDSLYTTKQHPNYAPKLKIKMLNKNNHKTRTLASDTVV